MINRFLIVSILSLVFVIPVSAEKSIDELFLVSLVQERAELYEQNQKDNFDDFGGGESTRFNFKSKTKAMFYSLLLPGAGQYYIGKSNAKYYLGAEAGLWLSYFGFRKYGTFKDSEARNWAITKAGANADNDDDLYWQKMTYYDNRDRNESSTDFGYNQMAPVFERDEAVLFPETDLYYWNWDSYDDRQKYRYLRNQGKQARERSDIAIGLVIANHIVSALEAYISAAKYNRSLEFSQSRFNIDYAINTNTENPSLAVSLSFNFN